VLESRKSYLRGNLDTVNPLVEAVLFHFVQDFKACIYSSHQNIL